jgi:hypothetical protein
VLKRIFGIKRDEVIGGWRKLHNEELHELYSSPNIIKIIKSKRMRWAGHVERMGEGFEGKAKRNRPVGRPRQRWEENYFWWRKWQ